MPYKRPPVSVIELDNASKTYGSVTALEPLTLEFREAHTTVLIGPSGCGKSTILRLIVGLIRPDTGLVRVEREVLRPENVVHLRRRMGYVIQEGGLFPHLTARANITLMARRLGWRSERLTARVDELTTLVHLPDERLDDYPSQLSGGQRQRVGLMRALMLDPDVLLLDEPLGALDPMIRSGLQTELKEIFSTVAKTVVLVTHDVGEAAHFADEVVFLRKGKLVQKGPMSDLLKRPADPFVETFIRAQRSPLERLKSV